MNDKPELELLVDIAKLLKKYGPETFEALAKTLSKPEFSEDLVTILAKAAKAGYANRSPKTDKARGKQPTRDFRSTLVAMADSEPEKSELLVSFYDRLKAKTVLPTLRDIQMFASEVGLSPLKVNNRQQAIVPLTKELANLPLEELRVKLSTVKSLSTQDERSLEGWSKIILNRQRR